MTDRKHWLTGTAHGQTWTWDPNGDDEPELVVDEQSATVRATATRLDRPEEVAK